MSREEQEELAQTPEALTWTPPPAAAALAAALHDAIGCQWQPHAGWVHKTHDEYHLAQAERLAAAGWQVRPEPPQGFADPYSEGYKAGMREGEGLRAALELLLDPPDEPLDADGFCEHGLLAGVACSVWEHEPWEQARAALASGEEGQ